MAEIKIRKKRPVWPWVLLILIIIAALLYFFFFSSNLNDDADYNNTPASEQIDNDDYTTNENNGNGYITDSTSYNSMDKDSLTDYSTIFSGDVKSGANFDIESKNVNRALINLIDAVRAKALRENVELSSELKQEREKALSNSQSAQDSTHTADFVKTTGNSIVSALQNIQKKKYSNLSKEVSKLQSSVQKIDGSKSINNQNHTINQFFDEAVNVLSKMN